MVSLFDHTLDAWSLASAGGSMSLALSRSLLASVYAYTLPSASATHRVVSYDHAPWGKLLSECRSMSLALSRAPLARA